MPLRKRLRATPLSEVNPVSAFSKWSVDGSGLDSIVGLPCYRTPREAERAWRASRRLVWAHAHRFTVPRPARFYDGLTMEGRRYVWAHWNGTTFDLAAALDALNTDRANLGRFASTREARSISDYLGVLERDLDRIEQNVYELAAFTPWWSRPSPHYLSTGVMYGHGDVALPRAEITEEGS
jgi:hypothetical protein